MTSYITIMKAIIFILKVLLKHDMINKDDIEFLIREGVFVNDREEEDDSIYKDF